MVVVQSPRKQAGYRMLLQELLILSRGSERDFAQRMVVVVKEEVAVAEETALVETNLERSTLPERERCRARRRTISENAALIPPVGQTSSVI